MPRCRSAESEQKLSIFNVRSKFWFGIMPTHSLECHNPYRNEDIELSNAKKKPTHVCRSSMHKNFLLLFRELILQNLFKIKDEINEQKAIL